MRWLRFAVLIILATILQAGVIVNFRIRPDLLLVLLVFFAVHSNTNQAIIISFTIGFAADVSMGASMGPQIISFGLFGTLLAYLHRVVNIRRPAYQALAIFVLTLLTALAAWLLNLLKTQAAAFDIRTLFWSACCSAVIGPFLFRPCAWWMRIKTNRFRRR